jgi:transcriptional regulator with GAF, ATPase, and Fis domain
MSARKQKSSSPGAPATALGEPFGRLVEDCPDCLKVLDLDGRLLSMNAGGMRALEICDLAPLRNTHWPDFWRGGDKEKALAAIAAARAGRIGRFTGYFETAQTKSPKWWDVVISPILDADGKPEKLLATSRDVTEWKRGEQLLQAIIAGTSAVTGREFFASLVENLAKGFGVRYSFVAECVPDDRSRSLAAWFNGRPGPDFEYPVAEAPCRHVMTGRTFHLGCDVQQAFPKDADLVTMNVHSYLGVPMRDASRRVIGHLVIMDDKPMARDALTVSVMETFASRAAAELQRERAFAEIAALKNRLEAENAYLQEEIRSDHNFTEIVGNDPRLRETLQLVEQVAVADSTVLILGETGTGKELIARGIHDRSARRERPLVKVNCGAISAGLVESELFGHVKGAFTGAIANRDGRFKLADGGTIFLDEVGELPMDTQVKLLRVLQEQEFEPIGSSRTIKVDVRVVAATNRDLHEMVREGKFRADLFYRLNVVPLRVPSLRERTSDIPLLATFFVQKLTRKMGRKIARISDETMGRLASYPWPGNVRELQSVIERAVILSPGDTLVIADELRAAPAATARVATARSGPIEIAPAPDNSGTLDDVERRHIESVLNQTNWRIEGKRGAAKTLNLNPSTLRSRMQKLGIKRPGR